MRTLVAFSLVVLLLAGCAAPGGQRATSATTIASPASTAGGSTSAMTEAFDCSGHRHATFRVFTPGADGAPRMLDMGAPKDARGRPYYDLGSGKMRLAIHMHQSGPEQGSAALGPAQLHYEGGVCIGLRTALDVADVGLHGDTLVVAGQHETVGAAGEWSNNGNQTLRFWLQSASGQWSEPDLDDYLDYQLKDGEAVLIAFGDYTDDQVAAMQASVPAPMDRPALQARR